MSTIKCANILSTFSNSNRWNKLYENILGLLRHFTNSLINILKMSWINLFAKEPKLLILVAVRIELLPYRKNNLVWKGCPNLYFISNAMKMTCPWQKSIPQRCKNWQNYMGLKKRGNFRQRIPNYKISKSVQYGNPSFALN